MIQPSEVIRIGTLRRPHGKRGEIQCLMDNDYWDNAQATFLILSLDGILVPFRVRDWRAKGDDILIFSLADIDSEEEAARLTGAEAYMLRTDLADAPEEDALIWQDLVGYHVLDIEQGMYGIVAAVDESTLNTLIILEDGRMLPIHEDFIHHIDTDKRILYLYLPFGL